MSGSIGVLAPGLVTDIGPRLESSLEFYGRLRRNRADSLGQTVISSGVTGNLTLERDGVVIVNNQAMSDATAEYGPGYLRYLVSDTLMLRGQYTWKMRLVETSSGLASTQRGRFVLK